MRYENEVEIIDRIRELVKKFPDCKADTMRKLIKADGYEMGTAAIRNRLKRLRNEPRLNAMASLADEISAREDELQALYLLMDRLKEQKISHIDEDGYEVRV